VRISDAVADALTYRDQSAAPLDVDDRRALTRQLIRDRLEVERGRRLQASLPVMSDDDEDTVARAVLDRLFGLDRLQPLLDDADITDIEINGFDRVFVTYRDGATVEADPVADSDEDLIGLVRRAAARMGRTERRFDAASPKLDLRLPGGQRLHALMDISARPCVTIRGHDLSLSSLEQLTDRGMLTPALALFLRAAVRARKNIVIGGAIGSGKTTLLRALLAETDRVERIVTAEDSLELGADAYLTGHRNVVALESRQPNIEGHGGIGLEAITREALRMNPTRVIVGEVRGDEMLAMIDAMTQGQDGSMCTIHARSARHVFERFIMYGLRSDRRLDAHVTAWMLADALDVVVFLGGDRVATAGRQRRRVVTSVLEVTGADGQQVNANEVFVCDAGRGYAVPAPGRPLRQETLDDLTRAGLPDDWWWAQ
jgi:Flp pilus assembly CpaF family ATPase